MYLLPLVIPFLNFLLLSLYSSYVRSFNIIYWALSAQVFVLLISILMWVEVMFLGSSCSIYLGEWVNFATLLVRWTFQIDGVVSSMIVVVLTISTFVQIYSYDYMGSDPHFTRFMAYLNIFTFFMLLFVMSGNYLQMFFGWEGVGLSSYLLINFWFSRLAANKAAMKAMIINRISDVILYFGLAVLFYLCNSFDYNCIFLLFSTTYNSFSWIVTLISVCIVVGAIGKSAQIGLHTWLPDAMEGPTPVSALLHAATMVTAGIFLLIRSNSILSVVPSVLLFILVVGSATTFFAGTVGCFQNDLKRVIAYSTCSQLGYMFLTCGLAYYNLSFFHLFNHAFFKALLFLGAGSVIHALIDEQDLRKMGGLFSQLPVTYLSFCVGSMALMGFPFLAGFYSKDLIIEFLYFDLLVSGSLFSYWLALWSVFFTSFYSARLLYYVFLAVPNFIFSQKIYESSWVTLFILILLSLLSLFCGFTMKDLFLGLGTDSWQISSQILDWSRYYDAEFSFFSGAYHYLFIFLKLKPLLIVILGVFSFVFIKQIWIYFISFQMNRSLYAFLNQKWFFDLFYFNFIIQPTMYFSYFVTNKLLDRGLFEFTGSVSAVTQFKLYNKLTSTALTGNLYTYLGYQFLSLVVLIIIMCF